MFRRICAFILLLSESLGLRSRIGFHDVRSRLVTRVPAAAQVDVDVAVVGAGPAGTTIAWLLQEQQNCKVAIIDPSGNSDATWYPNYGEWLEEWQYLTEHLQLPELLECTTNVWNSAEAFFGGSYEILFEEKVVLDRPYVRVDRVKLQKLLRRTYTSAGGIIIPSKLSARAISTNLFDRNVLHNDQGSVLSLDDGTSVRCKVVIDASGFESKLVTQESPLQSRGHNREIPLGYQIAYGIVAKIDNLGPYNAEAMTLFDYRTDHFGDSPAREREAVDKPTFLYVMPLHKNDDGTHTVFLEETSLVGKGMRRLTFEECKKRLYKRLAFHKMSVLGVREEEYCYIPMGGELPDLRQRVVAFGGAAGMVHPATGYHACRMMAAAPGLAHKIGKGVRAGDAPDAISAAAYGSLWSEDNRGQRDFQTFGGDFFMEQRVGILRGFFTAFFSLDKKAWGGFLAGWPGLPHNDLHATWDARLQFAMAMFLQMPNDVRLAVIRHSVRYTMKYGPNTLMRSLLPGAAGTAVVPTGSIDAPRREILARELGVPDVKEEARRMMRAFVPTLVEPAPQREGARIDRTRTESAPPSAVSLGSFPAPFH